MKIEKISSGRLHRVALCDDDKGHVAIAIGDAVIITSDGQHGWRRSNPGDAYGLAVHDGRVVWLSNGMASTTDFGATWQRLRSPGTYALTIVRDSKGVYWAGAGDGSVWKTRKLESGWKPAFVTSGKVVSFTEIDGKLFVAGSDSGVWNGKKFSSIPDLADETLTRISKGPSGTLVAVGDGGAAFRSTDGENFASAKTGVTGDLEDCAWVGTSLYVVGGSVGGGVLRSDDDGETFKKVPFEGDKLWGIASWGTGAVIVGEGGMYMLAEPNDPYWQGATDRYAPPPPRLDPSFKPPKPRSQKERDETFAKLIASAPPDANPELAALVDAKTEGAEAIYADWLSDSGDPRGELAQLQLRLAKDPNNKKLQRSEHALLKKHAGDWLVDNAVHVTWTAGFITTARMEDPTLLLASPTARFLRELALESTDSTWTKLDAPHLKVLEISSAEVRAPGLILKAVLPSLEQLTFGADDRLTTKGLVKILASEKMPRLKKLGIASFRHASALIEALAVSPLVAQLAELDLSSNMLLDQHIFRMFALQKAFVHLDKIVLGDNYLSSTSESLLVQAGLAVTFGKQRDVRLADDEAFRIRL